jgi:hypothetical protein
LIISRAPPPPSSAGWKDQVHRAVKVAVLRKVLRRRQQHGGVAVVAAGVHLAGCWLAWAKVLNSCMGRASMSARRPMAAAGAAVAPLARCRPRRWCPAPVDGNAPFGQLGRHHIGGAHFFKAQFGVGVDVAAHRGNGRGLGDDGVDEVHAARTTAPTPAPCSPRWKTAWPRACRATPTTPHRWRAVHQGLPLHRAQLPPRAHPHAAQAHVGPKGSGQFAARELGRGAGRHRRSAWRHRRAQPRGHPALQLRRHHGPGAGREHGPALLPPPGRLAAGPHHLRVRRWRRLVPRWAARWA